MQKVSTGDVGGLGVSPHPPQLPRAVGCRPHLPLCAAKRDSTRDLFLQESSRPTQPSSALCVQLPSGMNPQMGDRDHICFQSPSRGCDLLQPEGAIRNLPTEWKCHVAWHV